jgi:hypothetical protein
MTNHFLGFAKNGDAVMRASNRDDFTHAALPADPAKRGRRLPSFGTSAHGAAKNFASSYTGEPEIVAVELVSRAVFMKAKAAAAAAKA